MVATTVFVELLITDTVPSPLLATYMLPLAGSKASGTGLIPTGTVVTLNEEPFAWTVGVRYTDDARIIKTANSVCLRFDIFAARTPNYLEKICVYILTHSNTYTAFDDS